MSRVSSSQTLIIKYLYCVFLIWLRTDLQISWKSFILPDFYKGIDGTVVKCSFAMLNFMCWTCNGFFCMNYNISNVRYYITPFIYHIIYEFDMVRVSASAYLVYRLVINSSGGNIKGRHKNTYKNRCNACRSSCCYKPMAIGHRCIYKSLCISKTCKLTATTNSYTKYLTTGTTI